MRNVWLAGNAFGRPEEWSCPIPYYDERGKWIDYEVGDIVPVFQKSGRTAFYTIKAISRASWVSDLASFDDGRKYTLELTTVK